MHQRVPLTTVKPSVCVPIVKEREEDILHRFLELLEADFTIIEWRIDFYEHKDKPEQILHVLNSMQDIADKPYTLIATIRTSEEGGNFTLSSAQYQMLIETLIYSGCVDYVDVEAYSKPTVYCNIQKQAIDQRVELLASYHNFKEVPSNAMLQDVLQSLYKANPSIIKIACMPQSKGDILRLQEFIDTMPYLYEDHLFIAIGMGEYGLITRTNPKLFHSCLTFGYWNETSAPGQVSAKELKQLLFK